MTAKSRIFALSALLFSFAGCQKYSLSVNDNVVYTPAPIFKDYQIADEKLRTCVEQTLQDTNATRAQDLTQLNCSNAGIKSLQGLEKFYALQALNLSNNQISSAETLGKLGQLQQLLLSDNPLEDAAPLLHLLHLRKLDLTNNPKLGCRDLKQLANNLESQKADLQLPQQCQD